MDLSIQNFCGIRTVNPVEDTSIRQAISALKCRNVELRHTEKGNNTGIYTAAGNKKVAECPHKIIKQWESVQNRVSYHFVYAVDDIKGYLYLFNPASGDFQELKNDLSVCDCANAITVANGFYDWFVFTNGVDPYVAICMDQELPSDRIKEIDAVDAEGRTIRGLCLAAYDGRLVTNSQNRIHWSKVSDIFTFDTSDPDLVTESAYQELDRDVTALVYYNNMLIAFTDSYSVAFSGNPGDALSFKRTGATGGGCASFGGVLKFDNKLFYLDNRAKNIFAYYLLDSGQTRPTAGLADNVTGFLSSLDESRINECEIIGYVAEARAEIWFLLPCLNENKILIFDYVKSEWIERRAQPDIRALMAKNNSFYSASQNKILSEYSGLLFDEEFQPCEYLAHIINVGSDSNVKIPKMPLIITLDYGKENDFYIELTYDDNPAQRQLKRVFKSSKGYLIWAYSEDLESGGVWGNSQTDENALMWFDKNRNSVMFNLCGLRHFKQLQIRIFTALRGQQFGIKRLELKRVKTKTKTLG